MSMTERSSSLISAVEEYLSEEYSQKHLFLVPLFRKYYQVDLYSFKNFITIKDDSAYFTLYITQNKTMGMIAYDEKCRDLGVMVTVPIVRLFNFLTYCLDAESIANLEKAYVKGSINVFSERVSQLFDITYGEAEPIVKNLPKKDVSTLKVIKRIVPE